MHLRIYATRLVRGRNPRDHDPDIKVNAVMDQKVNWPSTSRTMDMA